MAKMTRHTRNKPGRVWTPEQKEEMRQRMLQRHHPELATAEPEPVQPDPLPLPSPGSPEVDAEIKMLEAEVTPALAFAAAQMAKPVAETVKVEVEQTPTPTKHAVTAPWKPARLMDIPKTLMNPNYRYRFVNTLKAGNVMKKRQEGWEPDTELQKKLDGLLGKTLDDSRSSLDSATPVRELILMRMPIEMAQARAKYYQSITIDPTKPGVMKKTLRKDLDEEMEETDSAEVYGKVEVQTAHTRR